MSNYMAWLTHAENKVKDSATVITTTTEDADYAAANLKTFPITFGWRSTAIGTQQFIALDFGEAVPVDMLALVNHNLTSTAVIAIEAGTSVSYGGFSATMTWREFLAFYRKTSPSTYQYWRIGITDVANPDGYFHVGYLMVGLLTAPEFNFRQGWSRGTDFVNQEIQSPYGVANIAELFRRHTLALDIGPVSAADMTILRSAWMDCKGAAYPLLFLPEREGTDAYFMRIVNMFDERIERLRYVSLQLAEDSWGNRRA